MEWREIPGFEGLYSVNENGDIYSEYTKKILRPSISNDGYKQCILYKDHKPFIMCNHKAVALAFIERSDDSLVVNHIDEDKLNCCVGNLEWVTRAQNNNYNGNRSVQALFKKYAKELYVYDQSHNLIEKTYGIRRYAKLHGLSNGTLFSVINANKNRTGNYRTYKGIIYTDGPLAQEEEQGTHNT